MYSLSYLINWNSILLSALLGCTDKSTVNNLEDSRNTASIEDTSSLDTGSIDIPNEPECEPVLYEPNPFATEVIEVLYGDGAGFGQESMPDIVLDAPMGFGEYRGSLDVLTLGTEGYITLGFELTLYDGEGADFIVFENAFVGWLETGVVSASIDGETWYTWDCDFTNIADNFPGCAGVTPTLSHPDNCIDARNPLLAGGDAFDLAEIGLTEANYIRIQDSGANTLGGFDLDAVAIIHFVE